MNEEITPKENPVSAIPEESPIVGEPAPATDQPLPSEEPPVTAPESTAIPPAIKETFLQKLEEDAKAAWEWLEQEVAKL